MKLSAMAKRLILLMSLFLSVVFPAQAQDDLSGTVVETMNSGGYTYVQIENSGRKTWIAVPKTKIEKGSTVTFVPGAPMSNFTSKTLGKTFDVIIFSPGLAN